MKQWEKTKAAARASAVQRNELRRAGPTFAEVTIAGLPQIGQRCTVLAEDASGRYRLPFPVKLIAFEVTSSEWSGEVSTKTQWAREDGRVIEARIVAWRLA